MSTCEVCEQQMLRHIRETEKDSEKERDRKRELTILITPLQFICFEFWMSTLRGRSCTLSTVTQFSLRSNRRLIFNRNRKHFLPPNEASFICKKMSYDFCFGGKETVKVLKVQIKRRFGEIIYPGNNLRIL